MEPKTRKVLRLSAVNLGTVVEKSAEVLQRGGVLVYPTDTIYGLGGDPFQPAAVERIYEIKGRDFRKPIHVLIGSLEMLSQLADNVPDVAQELIGSFWPGPLTIIFRAKPSVRGRFLAFDNTIGVRFPDHPFCRQLSVTLGKPILSTSANLSGRQNPLSLELVPPKIWQAVDLLVDEGPAQQSALSTIVKVLDHHVQLIREGAISREGIEAIIGEMKNR